MSESLLTKLDAMLNYFNSGATKSFIFRKQQLQKFRDSVLQHEDALYNALYKDLKKSKEENQNYD